MKKCLIAMTLFLCAGSAFADQCAYVSKEQAKQAVELLKEATVFQELCEPCGDTAPQSYSVETVRAQKTGYENYWQVMVNGGGVDLAYTYVLDINLAKLVGCETSGVRDLL